MQVREKNISTKQRSNKEYTVRRAEDGDVPKIVSLLERYVTTRKASQRYEWIYKRNPQGEANTWLACETSQGDIVGFTSIFAREFFLGGNIVTGGIGFDAFVRPDFRRRGIALALHRASRADMIKGEVPFQFMCGPPVPANLSALIKAGSQIIGNIRYLSLPLNTDGLLSMLHQHDKGISKVISKISLIDKSLNYLRKTITGRDQVNVHIVKGIDRRFDILWDELKTEFNVIGRRDAEYLNWRFLENPVCWQQILEFEQHGHLLGWAVLEFSSRGCMLVDYLLPLDKKTGGQTIKALINYVADKGYSRITMRFNLKSPYRKLFLHHGFLPGWSCEEFQVLNRVEATKSEPQLQSLYNWHFNNGDLNPEAAPWSENSAPQTVWTDSNFVTTNWPERSSELILETQS